jgi:SHS2 domain-containing protein
MTDKTYQFMDHPADIKFRSFGSNHEEAFSNAVYALTDIVVDHTTLESVTLKQVSSKAHTYEQLLYDFLEHIIILIDTEQFLVSNVTSISISRDNDVLTLSAQVSGDTNTTVTDQKNKEPHPKYQTQGDVKAITYHEMSITKGEGGLIEVEAVVDV